LRLAAALPYVAHGRARFASSKRCAGRRRLPANQTKGAAPRVVRNGAGSGSRAVWQGPPNGCHGTALTAVGMALLRQMQVCNQSRGGRGGIAYVCAGFGVLPGGVVDCT
jgi:hypothetical protein